MTEDLIYDVPMTKIVLDDCKAALEDLRREPAGQEWRIRWVGILVLLRTVADALTHVDAVSEEMHPNLRTELAAFPTRMKETEPEPAIYWQFIRNDVNDILHYYKFSAVQSVTVQHEHDPSIRKITRTSAMPHFIHHVDTSQHFEGQDLGRAYLMKSGPFEGQDQRDVVQQAIEWWEWEINEMILRAAAEDERILGP